MKRQSLRSLMSEFTEKAYATDSADKSAETDEKECDCETCESCTMKESFVFDKFVDDLLISESKSRVGKIKTLADSPIRQRIKRHQEKPINRIKA